MMTSVMMGWVGSGQTPVGLTFEGSRYVPNPNPTHQLIEFGNVSAKILKYWFGFGSAQPNPPPV